MHGPERSFPPLDDALVIRQRFFELLRGQVDVADLLAAVQGLRVCPTLNALAFCEYPPVQPDRVRRLARGLAGVGQRVERVERAEVVGAVHLLAGPESTVEHGCRLSWAARCDQRLAKAHFEGDRGRMLGSELTGPVLENPLEPRQRLRGAPGRQEGAGQVIARD